MLRTGSLFALTALSATMLLGAAAPPPDSVPLDIPLAHLYVEESDEAAMVDAINKLRADSQIPKLRVDAKLTRIARDYARQMLTHNYFGHFGPGGTTPATRLVTAGYDFVAMAENLGFAPSEKMAQGDLEASPEHRHNMLGRRFTRVGVGAIADSIYGTVFVQEFAGD